ncbi:MAG: leucine-rich repeat domain-containing protein [Clostridiales bacterium]|nr:leucine-rich repeat domain-containing protein [Clostridiales bacterium]
MKRLIILLIVFLLALQTLPLLSLAEDAPPMSGQCGDDVWWEITFMRNSSDGPHYALTFSGAGPMWDYDTEENLAPWKAFITSLDPTGMLGRYSIHIIISEGVTYIGEAAFYEVWLGGWRNTSTVQIADTVTAIGDSVFEQFQGCAILSLPEGVVQLPPHAFANSYIDILHLPESLETIAEEVFVNAGISWTYFHGIPPETTGDKKLGVIFFRQKYAELWAPTGENTWKGIPIFPFDPFWGYCGDSMRWEVDETTRTLNITGTGRMWEEEEWVGGYPGGHYFANWFYLTRGNYDSPRVWATGKNIFDDIVIGEGITSISNGAFRQVLMTSIHFPSTLESIGDNVFWCAGPFSGERESIVIPAGVTTIGTDAFYDSSWQEFYFLGAPPTVKGERPLGHRGEFEWGYGGPTLYYLPQYAHLWAPNGETKWNDYQIEPYATDIKTGETNLAGLYVLTLLAAAGLMALLAARKRKSF